MNMQRPPALRTACSQRRGDVFLPEGGRGPSAASEKGAARFAYATPSALSRTD